MSGPSRDRDDMPIARKALRRTYAAVAYAGFLVVALWAVLFLADLGPLTTVDSAQSTPAWAAILIDLGLWLVFGLQHSVMARHRAKRSLTRVLPRELERSTYVLATGLALGLLFWQWRALPATVWDIGAQPWVAASWTVYGTGWAIAIAATFMTDHAEFLGLRQAGWFGGHPLPATSLTRRWLYSLVRHPMMAGLLLAFWATPVMTAGHLLFALAGSGYIAVGVHFEERDLRRRHGAAYSQYARQVPRIVPGLPRSLRRGVLAGAGQERSTTR